MNPFDLPGPEFLLFYLAVIVAVHLTYRPLCRLLLSGPAPVGAVFDLRNIDPYLIAYLRGSGNETARVATMSLLDRRLLVADGEKLVAQQGATAYARRELEQAILLAFASPARASTVFSAPGYRANLLDFSRELERMHLVPDASERYKLALVQLGSVLALAGIAALKILLAISRGHYNIGLLVLLSLAATLGMLVRKGLVRTPLGDKALGRLRADFAQLKLRAPSIEFGGATVELALLAGIFGLGALPGAARLTAEALFPKTMRSASSSGSSCGSSGCGSISACGSTSSDGGGGSSCGGGGSSCGGGCGGCGS